ncbi:MAG: LysR family transcriptional regulator [Firmicutes bacterium]|nr:LysR family transcriptional regulator [Bacillota bacterium]MBR6584564.1 LysR family transcriptional regulator [Bacillota bacterium]
MDFKQIEAFVNVIKYKSFSKAAEATFLTQPTISTHISSLEKELGVTLIDRLGKESRPTKQGRAFYNYAINLINTRERAINAMGNFGKEISGQIDLRASSVPGQYIVPKLLADFHKEYPEVTFRLEQSDSEQVWNDILDNMGEIGFTGEYQNNGLKYELLFKEPSVLITPKNEKFTRLREKTDTISLKYIIDEPLVWREEGSATRRAFEEKLCQAGRTSMIKAVATVNGIEAVKQCVAAGLGVSLLSQVVVESDKGNGDYISFRLEETELEREFYMVYNKNTTLSPVALKFKEFVLEKFGE